jgi:dipeptidase D
MSNVVEGLVETSNNLSIVKQENDKIHITSSTRSSNMLDMDIVTQMIYTQFKSAKATMIESSGRYPGWTPIPIEKNPLLKKYIDIHRAIDGKEPDIRAIHAGLECGVLSEKLPGTQIISIGPEIKNPHSPNEYVDINSVEEYWNVLVEFLKSI